MMFLFPKIAGIGWHSADNQEVKLQKTLLVAFSGVMAVTSLVWGTLYFYFNEVVAACIPWGYAIISFISLFIFSRNKSYRVFRISQLAFSLLLPFLLMIALGGYKGSGAVIIWSLTSPLGALVFKGRKEAFYWFIVYLVLLVFSIHIEDWYRYTNQLPEYIITTFFAMNIAGMSITSFILIRYFVGEKNMSLAILEKKHKWIKKAFSQYISPNLVEHLIKHPNELKLGGERRECTFIFTDLVGFTSLVEQTDPEVLVTSLNEYFDGMTKIIFKHEGTLSKIVGDAISVIFSAPIIQENHAERAIACALEMDVYAQKFAIEKEKKGLNIGRTRIGVNTGNVIIGNVGSKSQLDYRALGDAINIAARLESANKQIGTRMCVSETTVAKCPSFSGRPIGALILKGKTRPVNTFEPLTKNQYNSDKIARYLSAFNLIEKNAERAKIVFQKIIRNYPNDSLSTFHFNRLIEGELSTNIILPWK